MKIIPIVLLLMFSSNYSLKAQEKKQPSKEETFEYILHEIADSYYYANETHPLYEISVKNFDKKKYTIDIEYNMEQSNCAYVEKLYLSNIKSAMQNFDLKFGKNSGSEGHNTNTISIRFKSKSNQVDISCEDYKNTVNRDNLTIAIPSEERAIKLGKAFKHLIQLFGSEFKYDLF
ncbi:hypothetical protein [Sphingobacterium faecium]|uniref:hypothetical protein n=1 Tax=Sphingobacterium faecium TaxID=34087 RepID=UPI00320934E6